MSSGDPTSEYHPVLANEAFWDYRRRTIQRKDLVQPWCGSQRYAPSLPGGRTIDHLLLLLSEASSTEELQNIITAHVIYCHRARERVPTVVLKNGFRYSLPLQHCGIYKCPGQGLAVREWSSWWRAYKWHPPMSIALRPATLLKYTSVPEGSFGPPF
jgi:hypothetical protein